MGDHYGALYQGQPDDAAPDELYVVPPNYAIILKDVEIFPFDGESSDTITVWLVPSGDSPADENVWIPTQELTGRDRIEWTGSKCLGSGYTLVAQTLAGGILNMMATGLAADETEA